MAISQQTLQNVEFLELRRVFKKETDDIVKTDEKILDVLKDNNALLRDLIDKIELTSISKGLGKLKKPKKDKEDEDDTGLKPNFFKEFAIGFGKRLEEYKEFFFGKKAMPKIEGKPLVEIKDKTLKPEVLEQPKLLSLEEKVPTPKFEGKGEMRQVYPEIPLLEAPKPIAPLMLEGPKKKQYDDVIDVTPVQSKTPLLENKTKNRSSAPLLLEGPKKVESALQSGMIPSKLVDDIASIRKAVLSDGVLVKVINPEEIKSTSEATAAGGPGIADLAKTGLDIAGDLAGSAGKTSDKPGGKVSKFLGMAGKAARVLGPAAALAGAAYSGFEGFQNTETNFDIKEGEKATVGQKISSTLGGIASGATFGLLSEKTAAQGIQKAGSAIGSFFGFGKKDEIPASEAITPGKKEVKGIRIADEPFLEGQPLSEKQMSAIDMAKSMGNKQYPPAVEAQYSKQKQEASNKVSPADKKDIVTPVSELSRDNEELKRQSSAPVVAPPIVSNTVQTNNTQTLSPIKAQPRSAMSSALERYVDRVSAFA